MPAAKQLSAHYARIGRVGGRKTSPAKRNAARFAALTRWGHGDAAAIPAGDLADGHWYAGKGRNADIAFWDARNHTFWVTCLTDLVSPSDYPEPGRRTVRLKREKHRDDGGTFRPVREIR